MKRNFISMAFVLVAATAVFLTSCSQPTTGIQTEDRSLFPITIRLPSLSAQDPQEGVNPDFSTLTVSYSTSTVYINMTYYNPVPSLSWGNPYIYLYDSIDPEANDMILFDSPSTYQLRRDKNHDGAFETLVYSGSTVTHNAALTSYTVSIPRGALPDITSRSIWAYSMSSQDRIPDSGSLTFSSNTSVHVADVVEGTSPDFTRLKAGYDAGIFYLETEYQNPVANLSWGSPYIYLYDQFDATQNYMIAFTSNSNFEVRQDTNSDGAFETLVYSGTSGMRIDAGTRFTQILPAGIIPSPQTKKIWAYSMSSLDRVPNLGDLHF